MSDPNDPPGSSPAGESTPMPDTGQARATTLYTQWRNTHLNDLPVEIFHRIEDAARHLIAAITKEIDQ